MLNKLKNLAKKKASKVIAGILAVAIATYLGVDEETARAVADAIVALF